MELKTIIQHIRKELDMTDYAIYNNDPNKALSDLYKTGTTILKWVHANAMVENWWDVFDYNDDAARETNEYWTINKLNKKLEKAYSKACRALEHLNEISEKLGLGNIISKDTTSTLHKICGIRKE